jgi:hypothetical protein
METPATACIEVVSMAGEVLVAMAENEVTPEKLLGSFDKPACLITTDAKLLGVTDSLPQAPATLTAVFVKGLEVVEADEGPPDGALVGQGHLLGAESLIKALVVSLNTYRLETNYLECSGEMALALGERHLLDVDARLRRVALYREKMVADLYPYLPGMYNRVAKKTCWMSSISLLRRVRKSAKRRTERLSVLRKVLRGLFTQDGLSVAFYDEGGDYERLRPTKLYACMSSPDDRE